MQGIYIHGRRPKSKKQIRELVDSAYAGLDDYEPADRQAHVTPVLMAIGVEATSIFGNEFDGPLSSLPIDKKVHFVGPDPHTSRNFYGTIQWNKKKDRWDVR